MAQHGAMSPALMGDAGVGTETADRDHQFCHVPKKCVTDEWKRTRTNRETFLKRYKDHDFQIISAYNYKGGIGKTTMTFGTAWALANKGKRVLVVDGDPQRNLTQFAMGRTVRCLADGDYDKYFRQGDTGAQYTGRWNLFLALASVYQETGIELVPAQLTQVPLNQHAHVDGQLFLLPGEVVADWDLCVFGHVCSHVVSFLS
jgi:hypothetical protein